MTDEQLVRKLAKDPQAFAELYARYGARLLRYVQFRTANLQDAEDITTQVFIRVLESHRSFRARYKFSTWIFTIAKHLVIDHYRKHKPVMPLEAIDEPISNTDLEQSLNTTQELDAALARLSPPERTMLILHILDGLTYSEIGRTFGVSTDAIKKRFERLKKRFTA